MTVLLHNPLNVGLLLRRGVCVVVLMTSTQAGFAAQDSENFSAPVQLPALQRQELRAQLTPLRHTTLAAELGAIVQTLSVREGDSFEQGALLVALDCSLQEAQLQKAEAEELSASSVLQANTRLGELNSVGKLEMELSQAALAQAAAEVAVNEALLRKCSIRAPFAGKVAEQKIREKQYVQPGEPLLDIIDDSVLELEFLMPSQWLGRLQSGQRFEVLIDETGLTYSALLTRIGVRVDPVSQSIKVAAAIDGSHPELVAGMSGSVVIFP